MSTTSMAIFSNPLFATYSVYARNASICCALASTCHDQCVHQIWSFYLSSFQRYKVGPKISKMVTWPKPRPFRGKIFIFRQSPSCKVLAHKIWSA